MWYKRPMPTVVRDRDIRHELKAEMRAIHADQTDTLLIDELGLRQGIVRVDLAVVNGVLHGYEIKSEADTLRRLPAQVKVYSAVLDFATLVTSRSHLEHVSAIVPAWWGMTIAEPKGKKGVRLESMRLAASNPAVDARALVELLWHDEALRLLERVGEAKGLTRKPRRYAWDRLAASYPLDELRDAVRATLKARHQLPPPAG